MCGILGSLGQFNKDTLEERLRNISHRGPDSMNFVSGDNYWLGHVRLSILDTSSAGNQPMMDRYSGATLIFNGEIYNHLELRERYLKSVCFASTSDTETLLHGLILLGEDFIKELNGIFSFCFILNDKFMIVRDRFGVKPLYFRHGDNNLTFSSELKSIVNDYEDINTAALRRYVRFLWNPGEETQFKNIFKLLPGNIIIGDLNNVNNFRIRELMSTSGIRPAFYQQQELKIMAQLDQLLRSAVKRQMLSDVPIGFFLSGGLDSSLLVAIARSMFPERRIICYTIDSGDTETEGFESDLYFAKKVAQSLDVELKVVQVNDDYSQQFEKVLHHLDEPQADSAPLNVLEISKQARIDGIKVLIGGTGGDDVFSGYRRHVALRLLPWVKLTPRKLRLALSYAVNILVGEPFTLRRINKILKLESGNDAIFDMFSWLPAETLDKLFLKEQGDEDFKFFKRKYDLVRNERFELNKLLFLERTTFLVDHNLNYTDKMGMAEGVEIRVPYLDNDLVAFANSIHPRLKLRGNETKYILKKVAEKYLPKEVIYRSKTGFGAPVRTLIKGVMREKLEFYLSEDNIKKTGVFEPNGIKQFVKDVLDGKTDGAYVLWSLMSVQYFLLKNMKCETNNTVL